MKPQGTELLALWSLGVILIGAELLVLWMIKANGDSQNYGLVLGGLNTVLPTVVNSIRNIRQSQTMQAMAEQLGQSVPAPVNDNPTSTTTTTLSTTTSDALDTTGVIAPQAGEAA